ncbi:LAMI_0F06832g1_1 [Lachancea mirantina]|uniref:Endonuclease III homolog n=1 Tax=Lachancea mirantina TaxID=1230905 RepID=A0A1G4JZ95_9SACH|nr:LAMI_0F06832g1_1 [Lachancea mirantina]
MVRRSKRLRVEVEVEGELGGDNETGEVSKYFKKEDRKEEEVLKSSCRKDDVDVEKVKKMDAYEYYDWVNARTKDDIGDIELVERKGFPRNFIPIYSKVRLMRSKIATPVDSVGCAMLPVTVSQEFGVKRCHISPKNYRFQLLIALMLSSQTRDEANAKAMFNLMQYCYEDLKSGEGLTLDAMFDIDKDTLTELLYPVSFYTRKTMYIKKTITLLRNNFDDDVPPDIAGMLSLPGVGPKMGYLALQKAWGKVDGIGVDVHVDRLCKMWKWVDPAKAKTPEHTRRLLEEWLPYDLWYEINPVLVGFGQVICLPRGKRCDLCMASDICNAVDKKLMKGASKAKGFRKSRGNYSEWVEYMENSKEVKEEIESDGDEKLRVTSGAGKS